MSRRYVNVPAAIARLLVNGQITQLRIPTASPQRLNDGRKVPAACPLKAGEDVEVRPIRVHVLQVEDTDETYTHREIDETIGHVHIVSVDAKTTLAALTYEDARREGYRTAEWRDELLAAWETHHGGGDPDRPVWVLTVRPADPARLLAYSGRPVGKVDPVDPERWHGPAGSEVGYTSTGYQAMRHEPEAVDVDPRWRDQAARRHDAARHNTDTQTPGQRLDRALAEARAKGVNTSYLEKALEQRLRAIQRAVRRNAA